MTRAHRRLRRRLRRRARRRDASGYAGFRCTWINEPIATVDGAVDPATFFRRFVATRTPCLLRRYCASADLGCVSRCATAADPAAAWVEAVTRACGDAEVKVELRAAGDASGRAFGLGRERRLAVSKFAAAAAEAARRGAPCPYYLTTQPLGEDAEGRPEICGEPCASLVLAAGGPPLSPPLLPTLVVANANLWMGGAPAGAAFDANSSGLHHDFHDNLLVLVCGRKRIRLWDPAATRAMRPSGGPPHRVHGNGRVVYASNPGVEADGRDAGADAALGRHAALDALGDDDDDAAEGLLDALLDDDRARDDFDDAGDGGGAGDGAGAPPENFSTLRKARGAYPALAGRPRFRDVVLAPGDALYMPCGFWHEVSSDGGVHAAFNYWLHPPDAADFARPYASPFWTDDWARRERDDAFVRAALRRRR